MISPTTNMTSINDIKYNEDNNSNNDSCNVSYEDEEMKFDTISE
jgi:hypothetical protein